MAYTVLLENTITKERALIEMLGDFDENSEYLWSDGNFGCDCNRAILFERAKGSKAVNLDHPCGEKLFKLIEVNGNKELGDSDDN